MMLLARLNPQATGVVSDDRFVMGRFDLSNSLGLLLVGLLLGVFGAGIYALLRGLMIGPRLLRARLAVVAPVLLVWAVTFPLLPLLAVLAVLWLVGDALRRTPAGDRVLRSAAGPWLVRAALAALFVLSGLRLVDDVRVLT